MGIGPLISAAIGDAYGRGFEFTNSAYVAKHNKVLDYVPHPKFGRADLGRYTDDTQMSLGLVEYLIHNVDGIGGPLKPVNTIALADHWVECFRRDPRSGYAGGFYEILRESKGGSDLLSRLAPPMSTKNGGAMRAWPCGALPDPAQVQDLAMWQASLTHASWLGMGAAAASALMFHHQYHNRGPKSDIPDFLNACVPGFNWGRGPASKKQTSTGGWETVQAALHCVLTQDTLAGVLHEAVRLGGDTDTVATIAMATASVCSEIVEDILPSPLVFWNHLEDGPFGRTYLIEVEDQFLLHFPRTPAKPPRVTAPPKTSRQKRKQDTMAHPLDFLFD